MAKEYVVRLSADERTVLTDLVSAGKAAARAQTHARILLKADQGADGPGRIDAEVVAALDVSVRTVERVREAWVTEGLEAALHPEPARAHRPRRLDGEQEAHLIAPACSAPPTGKVRWTMRLLAARLVELQIVDRIAPETVRTTLNKTDSSPG
jgi:transposase